jgi:hypothetical protein
MTVTPTYGARIETVTQIDDICCVRWGPGDADSEKQGPVAGRALVLRTTKAKPHASDRFRINLSIER